MREFFYSATISRALIGGAALGAGDSRVNKKNSMPSWSLHSSGEDRQK